MKSRIKPGIVNVGTIGHVDHGKADMFLSDGTFIELKTANAFDGKTILVIDNLSGLINSWIPEFIDAPIAPELNWTKLNKGYGRPKRRL